MRTAVVAGGAGGIGSAVAAALVRDGHRVVLVGRTESALKQTADRLGEQATHLAADLSDPQAAARVVTEVLARHSSLDVLVLATGGPPPGRVLDIADEQWRSALDLLLLGPLALLRAALPAMAARGFGRAVLLTSTAVRQSQPELATSTVLRAAVTAAAALAAREYAAQGVTVNCVAPGATLTQRRLDILRSRAEAAGVDLDAAAAQDTASIPAARAAEPDEIAAAVAFLASTGASYVNGTTLTVDGGRTETL